MGDTAIGGMSVATLVLSAQALATAAMCGLIWFVQVVHYPLFGGIDAPRAADYAIQNQASTLFVQVPLHARLARDGHAPADVTALVRTNWLRTIGWTVRAVLAVWMLSVAR
jgi:hypothetical protein